jgi:thioesterase domain-containing protein
MAQISQTTVLPARQPANRLGASHEEEILTICRRTLKNPNFGATDNFFDAGGNSLLALNLMLEIETQLGLTPGLETIFTARTVRDLCRALGEAKDRKPAAILPVRPGTSAKTLYIIHSTFDIAPLRTALRDDLTMDFVLINDPAWLRAQMADSGTLGTIRRISEVYADAIAARNCDAPFYLAGHSFAGMLAVETACRLEERGVGPDMVFLFDTYLYRAANRILYDILHNRWLTRKFRELTTNLNRARPSVSSAFDTADAAAQAFAALRENTSRSYRGPGRRLQCRTVLFRASLSPDGQPLRFNPNPGWAHDLGDRFTDVPVPGDHFSMLAEPHARTVAMEIDRQINLNTQSG